MLSKHRIKLIRGLSQKKYRQEFGLFTVEGIKSINEFLTSQFNLDSLYSTAPVFDIVGEQYHQITALELKKISSLKNPNTALALFKIPEVRTPKSNGLILALDDVRDPGNLGTIIRLCDWFGIEDLVCSLNTVDCFNSKVVQASMGSLTRVNVSYLELDSFIKSQSMPVFGTFMEGESIYKTTLPNAGIIILGNEANGISDNIKNLVEKAITIPQFGEKQDTESLNVANATAIILSEFKRRTIER
ncbi:TrmH family RNA methyltransferase [Winogradskyella aurantia]|uniref:RNA methyltransferase n=1 Tax=Winogradskyella aurantia TaxID=1915063 RepID=A0A265UV97_9FLAO|nr:RNA methyltransferase [Winogradskyella aurantia]OZV69210.1 RNA methyltransferase [Winogradskyella aurantia]